MYYGGCSSVYRYHDNGRGIIKKVFENILVKNSMGLVGIKLIFRCIYIQIVCPTSDIDGFTTVIIVNDIADCIISQSGLNVKEARVREGLN